MKREDKGLLPPRRAPCAAVERTGPTPGPPPPLCARPTHGPGLCSAHSAPGPLPRRSSPPEGRPGAGTPGQGALYAAELSVTHAACCLNAKTTSGRASSPQPPPGEKVVIGRETPDSSACAFMARDWILTFRGCAPGRPGPPRGRRRGEHTPPAPPAPSPRRGKGRDLPTESISRSRWRSRMLWI